MILINVREMAPNELAAFQRIKNFNSMEWKMREFSHAVNIGFVGISPQYGT